MSPVHSAADLPAVHTRTPPVIGRAIVEPSGDRAAPRAIESSGSGNPTVAAAMWLSGTIPTPTSSPPTAITKPFGEVPSGVTRILGTAAQGPGRARPS